MPYITCSFCNGNGCLVCKGCWGQGSLLISGILQFCGGCGGDGRQTCPECKGKKQILISQEEIDRQRIAAIRQREVEAERERQRYLQELEKKKTEEKMARIAFKGSYYISMQHDNALTEAIRLAKLSGYSNFDISTGVGTEQAKDLIRVCQEFQKHGLVLRQDTENRLRKAYSQLRAQEESRRIECERELEARRRQEEKQRKLKEEREKERAAKKALQVFVGTSSSLAILGAVCFSIYYANTPQGKLLRYLPIRNAINTVFKETRYSVVHMAGYSVIMDIPPSTAETLEKNIISQIDTPGFELNYKISEMNSPEFFPIATDSNHVKAIIIDASLTDESTKNAVLKSMDFKGNESQNVFLFFDPLNKNEKSMEERFCKIVLNKLSDADSCVNRYIGFDVKHPHKFIFYLPKNYKFDLIAGKSLKNILQKKSGMAL